MASAISPLLPSTAESLLRFGDRLRMARLRRRLSAKQVAERAGMSPMTLRSLERGGSGVTIGAYIAVMQVLGIERDLDLLVQEDSLGRALQDARLPAYRTTKARPSSASEANQASHAWSAQAGATVSSSSNVMAGETRGGLASIESEQGWIEKGGFASSEVLAGLIDPMLRASRKKR